MRAKAPRSLAATPPAPAANPWLATSALRRLTISLILAEQEDLVSKGRLPRQAMISLLDPNLAPAEQDSLSIDEDGLGFDSLSRLSLILRVNRFFHLEATGIEDYLLTHRSLGDWVALLDQHLLMMGEDAQITFATSGSAGPAKQICHTASNLLAEVQALCQGPIAMKMQPNARIVSLVPPHHIFGFLFTCLLPSAVGATVLDLHRASPFAAIRRARANDWVIGTPLTWRTLHDSGLVFATGVQGVTSAGSACDRTWSVRQVNSLDRMTEIYGATETGGLGTRIHPDAPFDLLSHLARDPAGDAVMRCNSAEGPLPLQDHLDWVGPRQFHIRGRRDDVVKVGGVNVSPAHVSKVLCACEGVAAAAVRLGEERMKAFVVPAPGFSPTTLEPALRAYILRTLPAPARPTRVTFGPELPVNAMGKSCDWDPMPTIE